MIDRIARIDIAGADESLYDILLGPAHTAGNLRVVAAETTRAVFATANPAKTAERIRRRGIELDDEGFVVNGLSFGLTDSTPIPVPNPEVELDHVVLRTADAERAIANYGGRLGIELRLERHAPQWGMHMLFFRCGEDILEIVQPIGDEQHTGGDQLYGVTWRVADLNATAQRLKAAGIEISEIRDGRKPGTQVCTIRDRRTGVPTLLIQQESLPFSRSQR
ncbi:VOC family protein [Cumulibacter soli]|uniref:VOC family protein n=1 Tax=Cumulibacter soli TaxID=2546344 RepID=UPI001068BBE9|nr:VOC family protein [Cumulibacter soli]